MGESGEYWTGPLSRRRTTQNKAVRSSKSFSDPYSDWRKNGRAEARRGGEVGRIGASWRAGEPRADGPPFFVGSNMKSLSYRELSTVLIASAYYQRSLVSTCLFLPRRMCEKGSPYLGKRGQCFLSWLAYGRRGNVNSWCKGKIGGGEALWEMKKESGERWKKPDKFCRLQFKFLENLYCKSYGGK